MAKGRVYQLVDLEGCRVVHVPLSAWPALTGIITDNQYQFEADCYTTLVEGVVNMACSCLPVSVSLYSWLAWSSAGLKTLNLFHCQAGEKRRVRHIGFRQESTGVAHVQMYAVKGDDTVTIGFKGNIPTTIPQADMLDVWMVENDFIRLEVTVTATSGTFYYSLWGELWTV